MILSLDLGLAGIQSALDLRSEILSMGPRNPDDSR